MRDSDNLFNTVQWWHCKTCFFNFVHARRGIPRGNRCPHVDPDSQWATKAMLDRLARH